jgi:hypothetical protein
MVSPVWYNIRRVGVAQYTLSGEHDVDMGWIDEVRNQDDQGEIVGRILPRFAVEGWDRDAYAELIAVADAEKELTKVIVEQVTYTNSLTVNLT